MIEEVNDLASLLEQAILRLLATVVEGEHRGRRLLAIGFVTSDDALAMSAFLLFEGDFAADAPPEVLLSPVEWNISDGSSFEALNALLRPMSEKHHPLNYRGFVESLFLLCASILERLDLRQRYGSHLFLTFASVDPSPFLLEQERVFVKRMNSTEVFAQWLATNVMLNASSESGAS